MKDMPKRMLRYAVAGSLAIHIIVAHFVRPPSVSAATEPPPERTTIMHIPPPIKKVIPTPQPPKPQVQIARRPAVHTPQLSHHAAAKNQTNGKYIAVATFKPGGPGPVGPETPGIPQPPVEPATPVPTVAPTPSCSEPDVAAHVITPITPDTPELARQEGLSGVTEVRVDLGADGQVESVSIYRTSGSTLLDAAALRAAKASRYAPSQHACQSLSGSYIFRAVFDNQ